MPIAIRKCILSILRIVEIWGFKVDKEIKEKIGAALGQIPSGLFILTAQYKDRRHGMLASWIQQVCFEPPMVSVAVGKGRPIMPLIRDASCFGLCQLPQNDSAIMKKFASGILPDEDPFVELKMIDNHDISVPILANVLSYLVCDLVCHMDLKGDHDLFIGSIHAGRYFEGKPQVRVRKNGFAY